MFIASDPYPDCNHNDEVVDPFEIIPFEEGNPCCFVWVKQLQQPNLQAIAELVRTMQAF